MCWYIKTTTVLVGIMRNNYSKFLLLIIITILKFPKIVFSNKCTETKNLGAQCTQKKGTHLEMKAMLTVVFMPRTERENTYGINVAIYVA